MLVRTQILLEEKQKLELERLVALREMSFSEAVRQAIPLVVKKLKSKKVKKRMGGAEFLLAQTKKAVKGPGDSEYDKYAYDY